MKKTITLTVAAIIAIGTMSFDIVSDGGKTGFTLLGCLCHGITATTTVSTSLSFNPSVANGYIAGTSYTVTATVANAGELNAGIDLAATAGTLGAGSNTQIMTSEITHTGSGNAATSGSVDFDFTWIAPASGSVTFNYVGLAGDNLASQGGDFWNKGTQTINLTTGITEQATSNINISVFPTPVNESTNVSYVLAKNSTVSATLINVKGQVVSTFFTNEEQTAGKQNRKLIIDPSISTGIYFLSISLGAKQNFKKIVIE